MILLLLFVVKVFRFIFSFIFFFKLNLIYIYNRKKVSGTSQGQGLKKWKPWNTLCNFDNNSHLKENIRTCIRIWKLVHCISEVSGAVSLSLLLSVFEIENTMNGLRHSIKVVFMLSFWKLCYAKWKWRAKAMPEKIKRIWIQCVLCVCTVYRTR